MSTNDDNSDDGRSDSGDESWFMGLETLSFSSPPPSLLSLPDELILVVLDHSPDFYSSLKFALTCSKLWRLSHTALRRWWKALVTQDKIIKALGRDFTKFDGVDVNEGPGFSVAFFVDRCYVRRSLESAVEGSFDFKYATTFAKVQIMMDWRDSPPAPGCKPKLMVVQDGKRSLWKWRVIKIKPGFLCPNPYAEPQETDETAKLLITLTPAFPARV